MKTSTYQMDVEKMLDKIFAYLVESGLGNISIRDVCKQTGISQGSLYYWFSDRSAIICEATEHGLRKVTDEMETTPMQRCSKSPISRSTTAVTHKW